MKAIIVNLECITNMHVGNGDVNFNIIDNEVEKDVITGYPTINASGVKGALREYFKDKVSETDLNHIFGNDAAGKIKILNADMLAIPMRASAGDAPYYLVSTDEVIEQYKKKNEIFLNEIPSIEKRKDTSNTNKSVEGINLNEYVTLPNNTKLFIIPHEQFINVSLPVIARNKLENGKSVNLWYEEVVPHKSLFTFVALAEDNDVNLLTTFKNTIENKIIQFGGNASIGYGLCKATIQEVK